jgi:8-oxo-dGTP diphosphatase
MMVWLIDYRGAVENAAPDEHDALRWVTAGEIADLALVHPSYRDLLDAALNA